MTRAAWREPLLQVGRASAAQYTSCHVTSRHVTSRLVVFATVSRARRAYHTHTHTHTRAVAS
jgi:hypothetical protein